MSAKNIIALFYYYILLLFHSTIYDILRFLTTMDILAVNSGHGGRTHDARVWNASVISAYLEQQFNNGLRRSWLLGMLNAYYTFIYLF